MVVVVDVHTVPFDFRACVLRAILSAIKTNARTKRKYARVNSDCTSSSWNCS